MGAADDMRNDSARSVGRLCQPNLSGLTCFNQGFSITAQIPIGRNLAFPTYATTNSYYSSLDPRLLAPGSYYSVGLQIPHVPLHKAGVIIDGAVPHSRLEWLADIEFTSANNPQNLPAYTIYNAGAISLPRGSLPARRQYLWHALRTVHHLRRRKSYAASGRRHICLCDYAVAAAINHASI